MTAKCRAVLGAMLAARPWDFVLQLPHLSDGCVAPVGFRGTPALSSQDGKGAKEKTGGAGRPLLPKRNKEPHLQYETARGFHLSPG